MPIQLKSKLVKKEMLKQDIVKFCLEAREITEIAKPGQFIEMRITDTLDPFLRRPISIYNIDKENGILEIIFRIQGKGTEILSKKEDGDLIDIIGPLGFGTFKFDEYKNIAILGGGIGVFPLYELAKEANKQKIAVNTYLGFRDKEIVLLEKEFNNVSNKLAVTTDDGSYGIKGFAINILKEDLEKEKPEALFACGPLVMLKAIQKLSEEKNIPCQISLEEKMGCGLGVCLGCAVAVRTGGYKHVCKQGPVFDSKEVII